jgi:thioredoxin 2
MMATDYARHIACPHCGSINRIPAERNAREAKCGRCHRPLFTGGPIPATAKTFETHLKHNDIPVLVDFWAAWCGPCKMIAPIVHELAGEYEGRVKVTKLDVDANPVVPGQFGVMSIPTLLLFVDGKPEKRLVGYRPKASLKSDLDAVLVG